MATKYEGLPDRYSHLINEDQYIRLLELTQDFLVNHGEVIKIKDGLIDFSAHGQASADSFNRFGLDNLVRRLAETHSIDWPAEVSAHFTKLFSNVEAEFNLNDFESIKSILGVRVYPNSYFEELKLSDEIVYKVDFEETKSVLVFDYPDKFQLVYKENFTNWGISEEQAFDLALEHASKYDVQIGKRDFETFSQFSFFSSTHSVSYILDFHRNATIALGKAGSLVNIPTQGSAFAIPIDKPNVTEMIESINDTMVDFFNEDPSNITTNYYWYYDNKFTMFQSTTASDGFQTLNIPEKLVKILKAL